MQVREGHVNKAPHRRGSDSVGTILCLSIDTHDGPKMAFLLIYGSSDAFQQRIEHKLRLDECTDANHSTSSASASSGSVWVWNSGRMSLFALSMILKRDKRKEWDNEKANEVSWYMSFDFSTYSSLPLTYPSLTLAKVENNLCFKLWQ